MKIPAPAILIAVLTIAAASSASAQAPKKTPSVINPPPTAQDWADIAKLPDWSGVWNPKITDQDAQIKTNPPPWNEMAAKQIQEMFAEEKAGRPRLIFSSCLPEVTSVLDAGHPQRDGNFVHTRARDHARRIGRQSPAPDLHRRPATPEIFDPTFHGHSIGHWEGDTLVVDTVDILPQVPLAVSEAAGVPNNGDMHTIERIHLSDNGHPARRSRNHRAEDFNQPWKTTRIFFRQRARKFDIVEGVCVQGDLAEQVNAEGDHVSSPWRNRFGAIWSHRRDTE